MKIKNLILLNLIIICLYLSKISCSEQNQEKKLIKNEQEILKLFDPMSNEWLSIKLSGGYAERLKKIKEYASKGGNLNILIEKSINWQDIDLIKFLLEQHQQHIAELFYKYIQSENTKTETIRYDLSNTYLDINSNEYIKTKEIFNLISYNKYLKEIKNSLPLLLQNKIYPKELALIIVDYYITHYEEFCNQNQNLINLWRDEFKTQEKLRENEIKEKLIKLNTNNNHLSLRCKKCIIQ